MKASAAAVFSFVLACCITSTLSDALYKRIVNGEPATSKAYPHQASLQIFYGGAWIHVCGASVISKHKLLTAAHCFLEEDDHRPYRVLLGTLHLDKRTKSSQLIRVKTFHRHPEFTYDVDTGYPNDIATVYVTRPIKFNDHVQPALLAPKGSSFLDTTCVMIGWGLVNGNEKVSHLMQANITKINLSACQDLLLPLGTTISGKHMCVFEEKEQSNRPTICDGDSGGPLMCGKDLEFVAGVVSWTDVTCTGDVPSVYTRVSEYLDWINEN